MRLSLRTLLLGLTGLAIVAVDAGRAGRWTFNERIRRREARLAAQTQRLTAAGAPLLLNALIVGDLATAEQTLRHINADVVWRRVVLYEPDGRRPMLDASPAGLPATDAPPWSAHACAFDPAEHRARIAADPVVYAVLAVTPSSHRLESEAVGGDPLPIIVTQPASCSGAPGAHERDPRPAGSARAARSAGSAARLGAGDLTARMPRDALRRDRADRRRRSTRWPTTSSSARPRSAREAERRPSARRGSR